MTQSMEEYKIVVLGGGGTGKNEIITPFPTSNNDEFAYDPTIEDSYRKRAVVDGKECLLDILHTDGRSEFSSMQDQWMREGQAFLLVYSITSRTTFDEAYILREKILRSKEDETPPIVLVGNKTELEEQRQVTHDEGQQMVKEWGECCSFMEISTANRVNCEECMFECVRLIRRNIANNHSNAAKFKDEAHQTCCIIL